MAKNTSTQNPINISNIGSNIVSDIVFDLNLPETSNYKELMSEKSFCVNQFEVEQFLNEGVRTTWYVPHFNMRGWGVLYMRIRVAERVMRFSTGLKIRKDCWSCGKICLNNTISKIDYTIHLHVILQCQKMLKSLGNPEFFCSFAPLKNNLKQLLNLKLMTTPKVKNQSIILLLRSTIENDCDRETTKKQYMSKVLTLRRFLEESNVEDDINSINQKTMRDFWNYLIKCNCPDTAHNTMVVIKKYLNKIQRDNDAIKFNVNYSFMDGCKDKRTQDEKRGNGISLTHDEIERLKTYIPKNEKDNKYKDLFIIQCQTGIRFEDMPLLLSSKNHHNDNGIVYAKFTTKKRNTKVYIPLNEPNFYSDTLELMNDYIDSDITTLEYKDNKNLMECVSRNIKRIAQQAGLDRIIVETFYTNGKIQQIEKPLWNKLSTHDGRRTFITNCQRVFNLTPNQIKNMSGHQDTTMIENVYSILSDEDSLKIVKDSINSIEKNTSSNNILISSPSKANNYLIDGKCEALSVLKYLGINIKNGEEFSFDDLVSMIENRQQIIRDKFGIDIIDIKNLFNIHAPLLIRIELLHYLIKSMHRVIN